MPAYVISVRENRGFDDRCEDPFKVIIDQQLEAPMVRMNALSLDHARKIAGSLLLLLRKINPAPSVVLDASIDGRDWRSSNRIADLIDLIEPSILPRSYAQNEIALRSQSRRANNEHYL